MSDQKQTPEQILFNMQFEEVMKTEAGRTVLWWLMDIAGTFVPNYGADNQDRDIIEGKRWIGLQVFGRLTPEIFLQMQKEANLRRKENDGSSSDSSGGDGDGSGSFDLLD